MDSINRVTILIAHIYWQHQANSHGLIVDEVNKRTRFNALGHILASLLPSVQVAHDNSL